MRWLVTVPNGAFEGKTYGVRFAKGRAVVDENTVDPNLGWTPKQVVRLMEEDFGYKVRRLDTPAFEAALEAVGASGGPGEDAALPQPGGKKRTRKAKSSPPSMGETEVEL